MRQFNTALSYITRERGFLDWKRAIGADHYFGGTGAGF